MATKRLTRAESRERTRTQIVKAAAAEFARNGFAATSIEDVVERAGYTRGAFYSNFASKDDLFLAVMDAGVAHAASDFAGAFTEHDGVDDLLDALRRRYEDRPTHRSADAFVLTIEFWLHAMRNPRVRRLLARRYADTRHAFAGVVTLLCDRLGVDPPETPEDLAAAILALDAGLLLQRLVDPDAVSGDLFSHMVETFLRSASADGSHR